ncbi:hypothetical protein [Flagellimonas aequoris]|uniref:Uncharacterized protein n=2 Tax=Flagellimonas aequoris TaxID=2306997 RepID=A0ABY3KQN2_9FLAO|nr:hypothetical protein [Allomuricauda aequoris]TXK00565.1 hypothetical protein FQ019_16770 [Allomuricauda aequoris]
MRYMRTQIGKIVIGFLLLAPYICSGQKLNSEKWSESEKAQYTKLTELVHYVHKKKETEISKDTLFQKYIYFDNVLSDTVQQRKIKRLAAFDDLFQYFRKTLDSIGLENLDAKPIRFYKDHKIYEPFDEKVAKKSIDGKKMYTKDSNVFAYYRKDEPENPFGSLLFDPETDKLAAWIMINQGGYKYFLTFNLF